MRNIYVMFVLGLLTILSQGCQIKTDVVFSDALDSKFASSAPIKLSFKDTRGYSFYFLLKKSIERNKADEYVIAVRSLGENRNLDDNTKLNIVIDNKEFIELEPISKPETTGYDIEPYKIEEEMRYKISYNVLKKMSETNQVEMRIEGKVATVIGSFQKFHATKAVQNFLLNAY